MANMRRADAPPLSVPAATTAFADSGPRRLPPKDAKDIKTKAVRLERGQTNGKPAWKTFVGVGGAFPFWFAIGDAVILAAIDLLPDADRAKLKTPQDWVSVLWEIEHHEHPTEKLRQAVKVTNLLKTDEDNAMMKQNADGTLDATTFEPDWSEAKKTADALAAMKADAPTKDYASDPKKAQYAIPSHMMKALKVSNDEIGKHVVKCFGKSVVDYIAEFGPEKALKVADDYISSQTAFAAITAERETPAKTESAKQPVEAPETPATHQSTDNGAAKQEQAIEAVQQAPEKPTDKPTLALPAKIEPPTIIDADTGEILLDFNPNRAIALAKGKSALVNRMMTDNVLIAGVDYGPVPGTDKNTLLKPGAEKLLTAFQLFDSFKAVEVVRDWTKGFFFYEYECTLYDRDTGKAIGSGIGSCNSMEKKYRFRWVTKDRVPKNLKIEELTSKGGKISEFDFAVEKAETSGQYGKPADYWKQFKDAIASGTAVLEDRTFKNGKPGKAWVIDSTMYGIPNEDIFDLVNTISKMAQKRALVAATLNATGASAVFSQDMEDLADFGLIDAA